jgi:UDP-N-acetylmuramoylalanine--D-glutamate ligase
MIPITTFAGKTVAVFGLGGSGLVTAEALAAGGARVIAWDDGEAGRDKARQKGITVADLRDAVWKTVATLVLSPGVPLTHPRPHWSVQLAQRANVEIVGDIELFCRERAKLAPHAPFIAITGTNGKSTTTALIAHILREAGKDVQMGGNIGTAILSLAPPANERVHVIECSSFQIDLAPSLNPTVGVLLNVTPDHLDRHGTMEHYATIKERLVDKASLAVVGIDDDWGEATVRRRVYKTRKAVSVSADRNSADIVADGTRLIQSHRPRWLSPVFLADLHGIGSLRGRHNAQNAAAAVAAVTQLYETLLAEFLSSAIQGAREEATESNGARLFVASDDGVSISESKVRQIAEAANVDNWLLRADMPQRGISSFPGLPHRLEEIGRKGRVLFVNDSKATNADSTDKALASFGGDIFWILGGKPKEGGIAPLKPFFTKIAKAYLIGEASEAFAATLDGDVPFVRCGTLDIAVAKAAGDATKSAGAEPVVLLSPACASYDQYPNFEVRGDRFRALVKKWLAAAAA